MMRDHGGSEIRNPSPPRRRVLRRHSLCIRIGDSSGRRLLRLRLQMMASPASKLTGLACRGGRQSRPSCQDSKLMRQECRGGRHGPRVPLPRVPVPAGRWARRWTLRSGRTGALWIPRPGHPHRCVASCRSNRPASPVFLQHTSAMSAFLSQPRDRTFNWSSDPFIEVTKRASCGSSFGADRHRKKPRREFTVAKDPLVGFLCAGLRTTARTATPPTCGRSQAGEN